MTDQLRKTSEITPVVDAIGEIYRHYGIGAGLEGDALANATRLHSYVGKKRTPDSKYFNLVGALQSDAFALTLSQDLPEDFMVEVCHALDSHEARTREYAEEGTKGSLGPRILAGVSVAAVLLALAKGCVDNYRDKSSAPRAPIVNTQRSRQ